MPRARGAAGERLPLRAEPDQQGLASAASLAGGESRARAATPATRDLSHAVHDGYEPTHRAEPEQRDRGRRRPCRRSSQPTPDGELTPILAPFPREREVLCQRGALSAGLMAPSGGTIRAARRGDARASRRRRPSGAPSGGSRHSRRSCVPPHCRVPLRRSRRPPRAR